MDCSQVITVIKDVILAVSPIVTAGVAVYGIRKWRQELEGKARFDVARALAKATYSLRDELKLCRHPFISVEEYPAGHFKAQATEHVYKNRWKPIERATTEFDVQALEAEALWGATIRTATDVLRNCVVELNNAIDAVIQNKASGGQDFSADPDFGEEMRLTVEALSPATNPLTQKIGSIVTGIENELKKHLGRN